MVIELKRDRAPRETVAQAIDYASWIATQTLEDVQTIAASYLKKPLEEAFQKKFGQQMPELEVSAPAIIVVASRLDASTERMIDYLSKQHGMDIDGLVFRYIRLPSGEGILVRTSVVSEERRIIAGESYRLTPETLLAKARERNVVPLVRSLRKLGEFLWEQAVRTYNGSFRYWGQSRMLCGVNVVPAWEAPSGTVDVWVSYGSWAQVTGLPEEQLVAELRSGFQFVKQYDGSHQMILRITSETNAEDFVALLHNWFEGPQQTGDIEQATEATNVLGGNGPAG